MTDEEITLPPLPEPRLEQHELELWGQNVLADLFDAQQMHAYARAAVLLDRQQRAAPSAEPVAKVVVTEILGLPCLRWLGLGRQFDFKGGELLYTTPPDHTAVMRQALDALIKARDTTYSDTLYPQCEVAIDALNKALGEKR